MGFFDAAIRTENEEAARSVIILLSQITSSGVERTRHFLTEGPRALLDVKYVRLTRVSESHRWLSLLIAAWAHLCSRHPKQQKDSPLARDSRSLTPLDKIHMMQLLSQVKQYTRSHWSRDSELFCASWNRW